MRAAISGYSCWSCRNSVPKSTSTRDGAAVTVAVATVAEQRELAEEVSRRERSHLASVDVTVAAPSRRTKNE